VVDKVGVPDGI